MSSTPIRPGEAVSSSPAASGLVYIAKWLGVAAACHAVAFLVFLGVHTWLSKGTPEQSGKPKAQPVATASPKPKAGTEDASADGTGGISQERMDKMTKEAGGSEDPLDIGDYDPGDSD